MGTSIIFRPRDGGDPVVIYQYNRATEQMGLDMTERYERSQRRTATYVGDGWPSSESIREVVAWAQQRGARGGPICDYISRTPTGRIARVIETKGRRGTSTSVSLKDRQKRTAEALKEHYWLYVAFDCGTPRPFLVILNNVWRLPWKLLTPPKPLPEGRRVRNIEEEGDWHVMPDDIIALGKRVRVPAG